MDAACSAVLNLKNNGSFPSVGTIRGEREKKYACCMENETNDDYGEVELDGDGEVRAVDEAGKRVGNTGRFGAGEGAFFTASAGLPAELAPGLTEAPGVGLVSAPALGLPTTAEARGGAAAVTTLLVA